MLLLIALIWLAIESAAVLIVAVIALLQALASPRATAAPLTPAAPPAASPAPAAVPPAAAIHPVGALAMELSSLPVARLREMAGTRSKRHRKVDLIAMLVACG